MAPKIIQAINVDEPERPIVSITYQGRPTNYELNAREDFGIRELTQIERFMNRIRAVQAKDEEEVSDADADLVARGLDTFARLLVRDCPTEVLDKLTDAHKLGLLQAFNAAAQEETTEPAPPNRATRRTSTRSSRPSSASTAAARKAG